MKQRSLINNLIEWDAIKKSSLNLNELIVFKFSPICAQSLDVQEELIEWYNTLANDSDLNVAFIDVINARSLSTTIAERTGIKHESPQIIWFNKNGEVRFSASHRGINSRVLNENLGIKTLNK